MYLLYVDESGDTGPKGSTHLILVGAALFEGKWRWVRSDLEALISKYFPTAADRPRELHASEVRKGRGPYSKLSPGGRASLLKEACAILSNLREKELTLFGIIVDKQWWFAKHPGKSGDDLYLAAFEDLISRFDYYLKRRHIEGESAKGLIIADPRHEAFCKALKAALTSFQDMGTQWAKLENVIETVLFLESHESPGVQLADLTSYSLWRAAESGDPSLARELKYCFDRETVGRSAGPARWHGIRYHGPAGAKARGTIHGLWPAA